MALTDIERVRLLIGDVPSNRFYPIITDDEIEGMLEVYGGDVNKTAVVLARSVIMIISQKSTKEVYGDVEVWAEDRKLYLEALKLFITDPSISIPVSFIPYAAGISESDLESSAKDCDNPRRKSFLYTNTTECCPNGFDKPITLRFD